MARMHNVAILPQEYVSTTAFPRHHDAAAHHVHLLHQSAEALRECFDKIEVVVNKFMRIAMPLLLA